MNRKDVPAGRRVTDTKPVSRSSEMDELQTAWDIHAQTKSSLRRAEFRLAETKPSLYDIGILNSANSSNSVTVDHVPRYTLETDTAKVEKQMPLDNFGRSSYMKSKMSSRKVAKMGDRNSEDQHVSSSNQSRSPLRESSNKDIGWSYMDPRDINTNNRRSNEKISKNLEAKELDYEANKYPSVSRPRPVSNDFSGRKGYSTLEKDTVLSSEAGINITDSRDIRETELKFLNSGLDIGLATASSKSIQGQIEKDTRLHHVDVQVPGASRKRREDNIEGVRERKTAGVEDTDITYTVHSNGEMSRPRKLKKDGMEKIRDLIRKQRLNHNASSSDGSDTSFKASGSGPLNLKKVAAHTDEEAVKPQHYELYSQPKHVITMRKVAAGPPAPSYRGFNEPEVRYQDPRSAKEILARKNRKEIKERVISKLQALEGARTDPDSKSAPKKESRKIAGKTEHQDEESPTHLFKTEPHRKQPKLEGKDRITPSSWREGERLIQQLVGPQKHKSTAPKSKEKDPKNLSEDARAVLDDLKSDQSDSDGEADEGKHRNRSQERHVTTGAKRSRPHSLDPPKEEKPTKVRHYDQSNIRQYLKRQKAERLRAEKEKEDQKRREEEKRRQQLEQLAKRTRKAVKASAASKRQDDVKDENRKGSDKENHVSGESSDSGTVTEGSVGDAPLPTQSKPVKDKFATNPEIQTLMERYLSDEKSSKPTTQPKTAEKTTQDLINQYATQHGIDDIVLKFAKAAGKGTGAPETGYPSSSLPSSHIPDSVSHPYTTSNVPKKTDRVARIMQSAALLSQRLEMEKGRITEWSSTGVDKWAEPRNEDMEYVGRYNKMTLGRVDLTSYGGDLPGVNDIRARATSAENERATNAAATKIQATYKGYNARSNLTWAELQKRKSRDDSLSDSTVTEDEDGHYQARSAHLAAHIAKKAYCVADHRPSGPEARYADLIKPEKKFYMWEEPKADPYSVLNIYSRKHKYKGASKPVASDDDLTDISMTSSENASFSKRAKSPSATSRLPKTTRSENYADDFQSLSQRSGRSSSEPIHSYHTTQSKSQSKSRSHRTSLRKSENTRRPNDDLDDTLNSTLTQSINSDNETDPNKSNLSARLSRSHHSEKKSEQHSLVPSRPKSGKDDSDLSQVSSLEEDVSKTDPIHGYKAPNIHGTTGYSVPRMSPWALETRHALELNLMDGTEEGLRQLTQVDKTSGVALAQQETVALAQILKERQQNQHREMAELSLKARQEKMESEQQLEDMRQKMAEATRNAAQTIADVRMEDTTKIHESTKKLIESQMHAAEMTSQAAKQFAEMQTASTTAIQRNLSEEDYQRRLTETASAAASAAVTASLERLQHLGVPLKKQDQERSVYSRTSNSELDKTADASYTSESFESTTYSRVQTKQSSRKDSEPSEVATAEDASLAPTESVKSGSGVPTASDLSHSESIRTESGAGDALSSHTEPEEVLSAKDLSLDASYSEQELEKSLVDVLPSKEQRQRVKKETSRTDISTDDFSLPIITPGRRLSFEEDSFTKFSIDMVKQYMKEEEIRSHHQESLLKLRAKALKEKTEAELAWLKQKQKQSKSKGADDAWPEQIEQKRKNVLRKFQLEKAEIERLQEANQLASRERRMLLQQSKQIEKIKKSTKEMDAESDESRTVSPRKDKSDFDLTLDTTGDFGRPSSPSGDKIMKKLKSINLKPEFLTKREKQLRERKKKLQELLAWKEKLDKEEKVVKEMEEETYKMLHGKKPKKDESGKKKDEKKVSVQEPMKSEKTTPAITPRTARSDGTIATDIATDVSTAADDSPRASRSGVSITEDIMTASKRTRSGSNASISEDIATEIEKKTHDSSDESPTPTNDEYTNEFDTVTDQTAASRVVSATSAKTSPSKSTTVKKPSTSPGYNESESDESFSVNASETTSDQSDIENRIRHLSDELKRRKLEAERLKKEQRRKKKERLREQEEHLKKNIEKYDEYISQIKKSDGKDDVITPRSAGIPPKIKSPAAVKMPEPKSPISETPSNSAIEARESAISVSTKGLESIAEDSNESHSATTPKKVSRKDADDHSITEDVISENVLSVGQSEASERLVLQLDLEEKKDDKPEMHEKEEEKLDLKGLDTGRSIPDIPDEGLVHTARSETMTAEIPTDSRIRTESGASQKTEDNEESERSEKSEIEQSEKSGRSYSYSTESRTRSKSYSEDFSDSELSAASETSKSLTPRSEASAKLAPSKSVISPAVEEKPEHTPQIDSKPEKVRDIDDLIGTEEDISEHFSMDSRGDSDSDAGFKLDLSKEPVINDPLSDFQIGDRVLVGGVRAGVLKFKGTTQFASGHWGGVELDTPEGTNNGSMSGVVYFKCKENHGIFAPPEQLVHLPEDWQMPNVETQSSQDDEQVGIELTSEKSDEEDVDSEKSDEESELEKAIMDAQKSIEELAEAEREGKSIEEKERLVNRITDDLTLKVVQDSMAAMGKVVGEKKEVSETKSNRERDQRSNEEDKERATEVAAQNLMNEAITQMLSISRKVQERQRSATTIQEGDKPNEVTEESSNDEFANFDKPLANKRTSKEAEDILDRPKVLAMREKTVIKQEELDDLYKDLESLTGEDDGWFDDDMGITSPRDGSKQAEGLISDELKLDLSKLTGEEPQTPFFAIPHMTEQIEPIISSALDVYWEMRRYGESWHSHNIEPPVSYLSEQEDASSSDMDNKSNKTYRRLIFDLTGEILREMYKDEDEIDEIPPPWVKPKPIINKYYRADRNPPTTLDELRPVIKQHVLRYSGLEGPRGTDPSLTKWGSRKKKDHVDKILITELREEEPDWVNYDDDELAVKMQLADAIFESLLAETGRAITDVCSKIANRNS